MEEKLPKIFANKVSNVQNNRKYYYSEKDDNLIIKNKNNDDSFINKHKLNDIVHSSNINKKIIDLFKSPNSVYKVKADIKINNKIITKNLIGRTNSTLITLDDEIINISDIQDINLSKN